MLADHNHIFVKALLEVLVRGQNNNRAFCLVFLSQCADAVIRLDTVRDHQLEAEQFDSLLHRFDLLGQRFRHGRAVGLVLFIQIVAERLALAIHQESHMAGLFIADQVHEHPHDRIDGIGRESVRAREVGTGVKRAVEQGGAVDEVDGVLVEIETFFYGHISIAGLLLSMETQSTEEAQSQQGLSRLDAISP